VFIDPTLSANVERAFALMSEVFGDRLIDARPLSSTVGRAGDGVHFQPVAAQQLALQLASALATTGSSVFRRKPWLGIGLGVAIFGTLGYLIWGSYRSGQLGDHLPGGKADGLDPEDFDPKQLQAGIEVELEHTDDSDIAQEIAMDHLTEDPDYYLKLKSIHLDGLMHMVDGKKWTREHSPAAAGYQEIACKAGIPDLRCWSSPKQLKGPSQPSHYQEKKPPPEKIPAYFVDPETGDVVEVDQRTAKYRREGETEFRGASSFADVRKQLKQLGVDEMISERDNEIHVGKIVVPKDSRGAGTGTRAMQLLTEYADQTGKRIVLTPSKDFGASSVARLKTFYKRFGFVENKGRNKDWTTRETMIRQPHQRSEVGFSGLARTRMTYAVYHQTDIVVEPRADGTGRYKTISEVKAAVRGFINNANWSTRTKSDARQQVAYWTKDDLNMGRRLP
jgi:GNAT superfamily N-acetyltransferase